MDSAERDRLFASWLEGEISGEEESRLLATLQDDVAYREQAGKALVLRRNLSQLQVPEGDFTGQVLATLRNQQAPDPLASTVINTLKQRQVRQLRTIWMAAGTAAAALIVAGLLVALGPRKPDIRIVAAEQVGSLKLEKLYQGERVRLQHGLLELDLNGRARVVIEAPAAFSLRSANHIFLNRGRCFAEMKKGDSGLLIETPAGEALDLGTQFGVAVGPTKEMEVHVFDGEVEVSREKTAKTRIQQGEAIALETSGSRREFAALPGNFVSQIPQGADGSQSYLHWNFNEGEGGEVNATGTLEDLDGAKGILKSQPNWIDGISGKALQFGGDGAWIETNHPGIAGEADRTVACWIRIPTDLGRGDAAPLVSWGLIKSQVETGRGWMFSVTRSNNRGGRLRLSIGEQQVLGTTDLRDGRWHHVSAVVMSDPTGPTALLYVDGQLENVTRDTLQSMETETGHAESETIRFGRQIHWDDLYLRGAMDEVFVIRAALSGDQVRALMRGELGELLTQSTK
ncbi:MAG: LamG-like jellyroll fold domain-containing protein [Verrucomicrobiota bacterium]